MSYEPPEPIEEELEEHDRQRAAARRGSAIVATVSQTPWPARQHRSTLTEVSMRSFLACFLILACGGSVESEPEPEPEPSGGRRIATDADPPGPHSPLGLAGAGGQTTR